MSRTSARPRRARCGERGAAAVEFALVVPLLVILLMGTITGGMAYYQKISMADAVREGARFAATADSTISGWTDAVEARTADSSAGVLSEAQVCVESPTTGGSCTAGPSSPPPVAVGSCLVRVRAAKDVELSIGIKAWDITLVQDTYARYERPC